MDVPARQYCSGSNSTGTTHQSSQRTRPSNRTDTHTLYVFAHPAPVFTDQLYLVKLLRPRLYLQLQQPSSDGRNHEPAIDVMSQVPFTGSKWLVSKVRTYASMLTKGGTKSPCNKKDIFLLESTEKSSVGIDDHIGIQKMIPSLKHLADRKAVGVLRNDGQIFTEDGQVRIASMRPNNSFEFTTINNHGEKSVARWVPAKSQRIRSSTTLSQPRFPPMYEPAFLFSLINPSTRRHAVLATLSPSQLKIKETYQDPTKTPTLEDSFNERDGHVRTVDEETRSLILATAVWLHLHLGWSPSYNPIHQ